MSYVKLEDVWKWYKNKNKVTEVLKGVNLDIEKGEFVVILGPSGEGKTTILKIISGLLKQDKGHVYLRGKLLMMFLLKIETLPWFLKIMHYIHLCQSLIT